MRPKTRGVASVMVLSVVLLLSCTYTGQRRAYGNESGTDRHTLDGDNVSMVLLGMKQADVRRLWGEPGSTQPKTGDENAEVWIYEMTRAIAGTSRAGGARAVVHRTLYTLTFENSVLMAIDEKPL